MKEKFFALLLVAILGVVGYVFVSAAAKHTTLDNAALYKWHVEYRAIHH